MTHIPFNVNVDTAPVKRLKLAPLAVPEKSYTKSKFKFWPHTGQAQRLQNLHDVLSKSLIADVNTTT